MHKTEAQNSVAGAFVDGPPGTIVEAVDKNTAQDELVNLVEGAGLTLLTPSTDTNDQVLAAVQALIASLSPNAPVIDFESKNLIINFQSTTTVDADADRLSFINSANVPIFQNDINVTFDITTDLMAGTSEKASHWYQLWLDSAGVKKMVPDLESTTDGTTASKLVDSGATFQTDLVQVGDIIFNLTDLTQTTVTAIDSETVLSVTADIFTTGEDYKIRMLSPVGLGASKARIGAAFNNSGSNIDDTTYTQIQEPKTYYEKGPFGADDFTLSQANWTTVLARIVVSQENDWAGVGSWINDFKTRGTVSPTQTDIGLQIVGLTSKNTASFEQTLTVIAVGTGNNISSCRILPGTQVIDIFADASNSYSLAGKIISDKKPTFHN